MFFKVISALVKVQNEKPSNDSVDLCVHYWSLAQRSKLQYCVKVAEFQKVFLFLVSGLAKAEVFGRSRIFSLFRLQLRPSKFYSKYLAFGFVLKKSCAKSLREYRLQVR